MRSAAAVFGILLAASPAFAQNAAERGEQARQIERQLEQERTRAGTLERRADFVARIVDPLQSLATAQVRVNHAALDRTRPDDGDLDHEIVEAAWPQARQHRHLRPRFDLKHPDRIAA